MRYLPVLYSGGGGAPVLSRLSQPSQPKPSSATAQPVSSSGTSSSTWLKWAVIGVVVWLLFEVFA